MVTIAAVDRTARRTIAWPLIALAYAFALAAETIIAVVKRIRFDDEEDACRPTH